MMQTGLIKKSIADFFSPKLLLLSIIPFLISFALFIFLYFQFGVELVESFKTSMDNDVVPFLDPRTYPKLTYILTLGVFKWLFTIFFYLVGGILVVLVSVMIAVIVIGFFTPFIVKIIRDKHYPDFVIKNENFTILSTAWEFVKTSFIFTLLFLICLPFLFISAVNFIAINIPFYYLYHNSLVLDVGSSINSKEEFSKLRKKHKVVFKSTTVSLYGLSLIPLVGMMFQVLFVIILAHQFFIKSIEDRK